MLVKSSDSSEARSIDSSNESASTVIVWDAKVARATVNVAMLFSFCGVVGFLVDTLPFWVCPGTLPTREGLTLTDLVKHLQYW